LHAQLSQRLQQAEARMADGPGQGQMARMQAEIDARLAAASELRAEQAALVTRIEKAEAASRESTAGLRQAAGAAIADLRNSQLNLAARLRQMEDGGGGGAQLAASAELKAQQGDIARRLAALESARTQNPVDHALKAFEQRLDDIASRVGDTSKFEKRLQDIAEKVGESAASKKLDDVDGAVRTLDRSLGQLSARIAETETSGNSAIRALEATVSSLAARVDASDANEETEKLRAMLEQRLDAMAQSVSQTVGDARSELAGQIQAVLGGAEGEGLEGALEDVNRRLAAAERRQAQTIEAISVEIKRMSETVDRRLRAVEAKAEDGEPSGAVREELQRMGQSLEARFEEIERREAAAFDRMGLEIGRLSEHLEERVGAVEGRSAQPNEQVGEQVARKAERFNQRHEILSRELGERMLDSEERAGARVSDAINSIMQRLGEVEENSREAVGPVQKVVSDVASRLENLENRSEPFADAASPRAASSFDAATAFASDPYNAKPYAPETAADPYVSPMQAAQPARAGPIAHTPIPPAAPIPPSMSFPTPDSDIEAVEEEGDIYFADDDDFLAENVDAPSQQDNAARAETEELTFEKDSDDDLLDDGAFLEIEDSFSASQEDDEDEDFWNPDTAEGANTAPTETTPEEIVFEPLELEPQSEEPAKKDYLTAARMAAQAQSVTGKRGQKTSANEYAAAPAYSLRGSSRVVLWGATSALALLIAGGAWYLNQGANAPEPSPAAAAPDADPASELPAEGGSFDPDAAFGPPVADDLDASGGVEGAPEEPASADAPGAELQSGTRLASAVAGPLSPRSLTLDQAARNGDSVAQYELALQRLSSGDREEGVTLLRRAADRGLAMAQYRLAKLYERGEGVPTDLTMARQWTERAAGSGNRRAMHDLGVYYARGEGAPLDESAAFRWFRQAAELGVADSQYNLGVLYQQGRGVSANAGEAMFWFLVASRQGDEDAGARASALEPQMSPMQIEQARARAGAFRPRAASAPANGQFGPRPWSGDASRPSGA
jgi:localization factor PodJL